MRGAVIHGERDVRVKDRPDPRILAPGDAVVDTVAACVCGSDLWKYRGVRTLNGPTPIGHEYVGLVREVGADVRTVRPGQFVIGGFMHSCNTCPTCAVGMQANCPHGGGYDGCQAEAIRIPNADGTLVATPEMPDASLVPHLLTLSDVMATGWHAATAAGVREGDTVVVVGDGAVGLCGVLAAAQLRAGRIVAMSRYAPRQVAAREFGATDVVTTRGDEGVAEVLELTDGLGADAVLECVGTQDSVLQALRCARPGGTVGWVGLPHLTSIPQEHMFYRNVGIRGGVAPVRAYLPDLLDRVLSGALRPGSVFDLTLPLEETPEGYAAMDERRAIKTLLHVRDV